MRGIRSSYNDVCDHLLRALEQQQDLQRDAETKTVTSNRTAQSLSALQVEKSDLDAVHNAVHHRYVETVLCALVGVNCVH